MYMKFEPTTCIYDFGDGVNFSPYLDTVYREIFAVVLFSPCLPSLRLVKIQNNI